MVSQNLKYLNTSVRTYLSLIFLFFEKSKNKMSRSLSLYWMRPLIGSTEGKSTILCSIGSISICFNFYYGSIAEMDIEETSVNSESRDRLKSQAELSVVSFFFRSSLSFI